MGKLTFTKHTRQGEENHEIVLISYHNGIPHSVFTRRDNDKNKFMGIDEWDFDPNMNWGGELMYYNSGSGGYEKYVLSTHSITSGKKACYWLADGYTLRDSVKTKRVSEPLLLKGNTINPFEAAEEVESTCYCAKCKGMIGDSICDNHMYEDDEGEFRYRGNHRMVG